MNEDEQVDPQEQQEQQEEPAIVSVGFGGRPDAVVEMPPVEGEGNLTDDDDDEEQDAEDTAPPVEDAARRYAGKYKTVEELEQGYKEAERMASEKAQELARFSHATDQDTQESDPLELAPLLQQPPQNLLEDQRFIDYAQSKGVKWVTDLDGYIDMESPTNVMNLQYAREQLTGQVQQAYYAQQQQQQTFEATERAVEQSLTAINPLLMDPEAQPLTGAIAQQLLAQVQNGERPWQGPEAFAREVADSVTRAAARIMGNRGGTAAAQARQVATPPPAPIGATGAAPRGGTSAAPTAFEDLSDWGR